MRFGTMAFAVFVCLFLLLSPSVCFAAEAKSEVDTLVGRQLEMLELSELDASLEEAGEGNALTDGFHIQDMIMGFLKGENPLSLSELGRRVFAALFSELREQLGFIQKILMIAILSAMLKNINTSFYGKSVGELGFYICYIVLVILIASSFYIGLDLVGDAVGQMVSCMEAVMPVITALLAAGGSYAQMAVSGPVIVGAAGLSASLIRAIILPAISLSAMLQLLNCISEQGLLSRMTDLLKSVTGWALKGFSLAFMLIVSLQRLGLGGINKLAGRTARTVVGAVPVVGDVMQGAVEMAATLSGAVRNSLAAAFIIFMILLILFPVLKLLVMIFIYKLTAAVLEPVCESRLIKCISSAGDFSVLLLSTLFAVGVMFLFSVIVLLGAVP